MKGFKGDCKLHKENEDWLYSKIAGAKLCVGCVRDRLYRDAIYQEVTGQHPDYFTQASAEEGNARGKV